MLSVDSSTLERVNDVRTMSKLWPVQDCIGACPSHSTHREDRQIKELLLGSVHVVKHLAQGYMYVIT